jgi:hypothetical protein
VNFTRVKIVTTVPPKDADVLRDALGRAGAGRIGEYSFCSFSVLGKGRFKASQNADPHVGKPGAFVVVEEEQIEVTCDRNQARQVIAALKQAHPYEEPMIEVVPLIDEQEFLNES